MFVLASSKLISVTKKTVVPMTKMKTQSYLMMIQKITLLMNVTVKKILKRMKVQMMIGLLKIKHLEITWCRSLILAKTIVFMIRASKNNFKPSCTLIMLYKDKCVKYVKCITVVSHVHLVEIEVLGPIQV